LLLIFLLLICFLKFYSVLMVEDVWVEENTDHNETNVKINFLAPVRRDSQIPGTTTADKPKLISTDPADGDCSVPQYRTIDFIFNEEIASASVKIVSLREGVRVSGKTEIKQENVTFQPSYAFLPDSSYEVFIKAESAEHVITDEYKLSFTTVGVNSEYWVDVKLGEKHTVTVYKGTEKVRHMPASGGRPDSPTPLGQYYSQDRGYCFWSARFGEGASYWVRLVGQVLIHSVPKDSQWRTKEEEHAKLGLPASHGCIRLDEKDAKWFYENISGGTLVIIHE
jgi:lipoprotein-anchoring transpeptidase ErfK/SrfK